MWDRRLTDLSRWFYTNYPDELCKSRIETRNLYLFLHYCILSNYVKNSAEYKYKQSVVRLVQHLYTQTDHPSRRTTQVSPCLPVFIQRRIIGRTIFSLPKFVKTDHPSLVYIEPLSALVCYITVNRLEWLGEWAGFTNYVRFQVISVTWSAEYTRR